MLRRSISLTLLVFALGGAALDAQQAVVRTGDPIKRGLKLTDFPRTIKIAENVYTYEDFHAGPEKFTTTNLFVVTRDGVLVADGQGSVPETKGLVDAIAKVTTQPIRTVVIASDHGDHTAGNAAFPAGVRYIIHPTSKEILDRSAKAFALRESGGEARADGRGAEVRADGRGAARGDGAGATRGGGRGGSAPWTVPADAQLV